MPIDGPSPEPTSAPHIVSFQAATDDGARHGPTSAVGPDGAAVAAAAAARRKSQVEGPASVVIDLDRAAVPPLPNVTAQRHAVMMYARPHEHEDDSDSSPKTSSSLPLSRSIAGEQQRQPPQSPALPSDVAAQEGQPADKDVIVQCARCRRFCDPTDRSRWKSTLPRPTQSLRSLSHDLCPLCLDLYYGE